MPSANILCFTLSITEWVIAHPSNVIWYFRYLLYERESAGAKLFSVYPQRKLMPAFVPFDTNGLYYLAKRVFGNEHGLSGVTVAQFGENQVCHIILLILFFNLYAMIFFIFRRSSGVSFSICPGRWCVSVSARLTGISASTLPFNPTVLVLESSYGGCETAWCRRRLKSRLPRDSRKRGSDRVMFWWIASTGARGSW